jgi:hypothetical protein
MVMENSSDKTEFTFEICQKVIDKMNQKPPIVKHVAEDGF